VRRGAEPAFIDPAPDTVLGAMPAIGYEQRSVQMRPGDLLLLYSDGVTEAFDARGDAYGPERLRQSLSASDGAGAMDIVEKVHAGVAAFAAGAQQSDDITLFAVRYLGRGEEGAGT